MVIGPQSYHKIADLILDKERKKEKINATEFDVIGKFDKLEKIPNFQNKISSYLTIQEGCDKFCHFCVVPYTRGPEYSRPFEQIVNEARILVSNGAREITLLGQNVNAYNFNKKYRLSNLIRKLSDIKNLKRIRYTTSHPKDVTKDLIQAHQKCEKLMPLLHLPVQSGSTNILEKMNRNHTIKDYLEKIEDLKQLKPSIKFSSDFIIGYPGETDEDFEQTISLMKKVKFINSYSFIFSPRPGTPAANQEEVGFSTAKKRLLVFQNVANDIKKKYRKSLINTVSKVLFENKVKENNAYFGRDEYFNSVIVKSSENLTGKIKNIKINKCNHNTLFGENIVSKQFKEEEFAA
jgi:tRNA-2-methylthio-N6-dimethylallyladenosine synthase